MYKTISFPKHESGTGKIERLRINLAENDENFDGWFHKLGSADLRKIIKHNYSDLEKNAVQNHKPISSLALELIKTHYEDKLPHLPSSEQLQLNLFTGNGAKPLGRHGTFSLNRTESIHRWYPYLEGYSSTFVESLISKWGNNVTSIYDPFAGTGTTMTVAAMNGMQGYYSEINPFMRLVIECKTNNLKEASKRSNQLEKYLNQILDFAACNQPTDKEAETIIAEAFSGRPYFSKQRLAEVLSLKNAISQLDDTDDSFKNYAKLALGSIAVQSSELKRSADLRYRRDSEKLPENFSVYEAFREKINHILSDISPEFSDLENVSLHNNSCLSENKHFHSAVGMVVTSPPYLNGTNYFRNTKIELWLTSFIRSEKDLGFFTREAMTAGINNVSKNGRALTRYECVEEVALQLDEKAYDRRIPELVRRYCADTERWLKNAYSALKDGGNLVIDIGDSRFAGVHVPTDKFIVHIANQVGFNFVEEEFVRVRTSKDGSKLKQSLLLFKKNNAKNDFYICRSDEDLFASKAEKFANELPHKTGEYASRNWGHSLHSLCSYQGKLKPAIAHFLVDSFTEKQELVLDPLSGAGTIPLEAFLCKRQAIANDIQELGYILSSAKVAKPDPKKVFEELEGLNDFIEGQREAFGIENYSDFGFNGKVSEYFEDKTYREVLAARSYLKNHENISPEKALVFSSMLHILHGNRPYALSRTSHPVTPFKPKGDFEYRDIKSRLTSKVMRSLESIQNDVCIDGVAYNHSFENLHLSEKVNAVITSPPFAASTRFYSSNWMRLWLAGWEPEDFKEKKVNFLEHRQRKDFSIYQVFFEKCLEWLVPQGKIIMHLGKTEKVNMADEIIRFLPPELKVVYCFDESVNGREKFGIKDQGATTDHQYLFIMKL